MRLLRDIFLQDLGFCGLWVPKVHHLIKEFIDDDEVVSYRFLFELFEIFREHLHDLMEEEKDFGSIRVALGQGKKIKIIMTDIEVLGVVSVEPTYSLLA
jgi:hypothetical protein